MRRSIARACSGVRTCDVGALAGGGGGWGGGVGRGVALKPGTGNKKWEMGKCGNAEMGSGGQKRGRQGKRRDYAHKQWQRQRIGEGKGACQSK